jgi:purine-nucleoside phosphorylase
MVTIQLSALYFQAFGIFGKKPPDMEVMSVNEKADMKSIMGTPIFMPFKIDDIWLPNEPLVTITGGKKIIRTVVAGLKGSVKEEICLNDYMVVIRGIIINNDSDDYPDEEVGEIRGLCEAEGSREIVNKLCRIFGINSIAIESYNIFGIAGHQSQQAYQINAWSDRPVELVLKEGL